MGILLGKYAGVAYSQEGAARVWAGGCAEAGKYKHEATKRIMVFARLPSQGSAASTASEYCCLYDVIFPLHVFNHLNIHVLRLISFHFLLLLSQALA